jgi:hypothetical protein
MHALYLYLALASGFFHGGGEGPKHPQDGPDADVRIHVEADRVRFFIMLNLAFVDEIVDIAREDESALHPAEYNWYRKGLYDYFHDTNRVVIDGLEVTPVESGFEALPADLSMLPLFPRMGRRALAKVQLVLDYPVKMAPKQVKIFWGSFPPDRAIGDDTFMPSVTIRAQIFAEGIASDITFTEEEPENVWHNSGRTATDLFLAIPEAPVPQVFSFPLLAVAIGALSFTFLLRALRRRRPRMLALSVIALIGAIFTRDYWVVELDLLGSSAQLLSPAQAEAVFLPLHSNIYRAFDYTAESDIYDALAQSVDGPLLDNLYNQVYRGLIMQDQGGAVSRVSAVRPIQTDIESVGVIPEDGRNGFDVRIRWQVDGRVTHWGHSHERTNEYLARYTVVQTDDGWRIGGSQMLEQQRVSATPEGG